MTSTLKQMNGDQETPSISLFIEGHQMSSSDLNISSRVRLHEGLRNGLFKKCSEFIQSTFSLMYVG